MNTSILSHKSTGAKIAGVTLILALLLGLALLGGFARTSLAAPAADITVDGSTCTLSDAITAANTDTATGGCTAGSSADTLLITNSISLSSAVPAITSEITIEGGGHTISGDGSFAILTVGDSSGSNPGTLTLKEAYISGGTPGIEIQAGSTVTVDHSTITGNTGDGTHGGGINVDAASRVTVVRSTISHNSAPIGGGIRLNSGSSAVVLNSTISNNSADAFGGGIEVGENCTLTVESSTFTANSAFEGGGIGASSAGDEAVTVLNSIVAGNTGGDCSGTTVTKVSSQGYNIESGSSCFFMDPNDQQNTDPLLGPLADNGGPTQTHFPLNGSPILDKGSCSLGTDQRGDARPVDLDDTFYPNGTGGACDIGAVEAQDSGPNAITLQSLNATATTPANWLVATLLAGFATLVGAFVLRKRSL